MHIFFSGIGGAAIGPLSLIAREAGYEVSGSDQQDSQYIHYLRSKGVTDIHVGQTAEAIVKLHERKPIDWYVYSSAIEKTDPHHPELEFVALHSIKKSKRDELLNKIINDKQLKLVAAAGTHGKTTTTAMMIWLFKELGVPISYSVGAKIDFGDMGQYVGGAEYFIYEADEFDRNFLHFNPHLSIITGLAWDHHEIFPTREDYNQAFRQFIQQSQQTILWQREMDYLGLEPEDNLLTADTGESDIDKITLPGRSNRENAWLAMRAVTEITGEPYEKLTEIINKFPGLQRRMEEIVPGLYSDYAHTPEKIVGAMSVAVELAAQSHKDLVVVYEPLTNRRQHYMMDDYGNCFAGATKVYWLPSYLAREDPTQRILAPEELITHLADPTLAHAAQKGDELKQAIQQHLDAGSMVVAMAGGGGNSLDEWIRKEFGGHSDCD